MTSDRDPLLDTLGALPASTPSAAATERLRARCYAALGRPPQIQTDSRWPWLFIAVSLLYLAAAVAQALAMLRLTS
jgi:hypothetical protein